jgi:hypothetical protein
MLFYWVSIYSILKAFLFNNLFFIYLQEVAQECQNMNWGTFKVLLTDSLIDHLHPIQVATANMMPFFSKLWCMIIDVCMLYLFYLHYLKVPSSSSFFF